MIKIFVLQDFVCVICGKTILQEWGNNPNPIKKGGKCCNACNMQKVIPARIFGVIKKGGEK